MDLMYRNEKYQEYLKKIKVAGNDVQEQMFLKGVKEKAQITLQELKSDDDNSTVSTFIWLLAIPLILMILSAIVRFEYLHVIPLVFLFGYMFYYRTSMMGVTKKATSLKGTLSKSDFQNIDSNSWLKQKIEYIICGIEIKKNRLKLIKNLYLLFFPILLYYLHLHVFGSPAFNNTIAAIAIAYLLGSSIWIFFFGDELEYYESLESSFVEDLNKLLLK